MNMNCIIGSHVRSVMSHSGLKIEKYYNKYCVFIAWLPPKAEMNVLFLKNKFVLREAIQGRSFRKFFKKRWFQPKWQFFFLILAHYDDVPLLFWRFSQDLDYYMKQENRSCFFNVEWGLMKRWNTCHCW